MIKKILAGAVALALVGCVNTENEQSNNAVLTQSVKYPITKTGTVVDNYFGTQVADPYRWLEDDKSAETAAWVKAQNEATQAYLSQIPYRKDIEKRLTELLDYERVSQPFKHGNYTYFYKNDGLQNQSVLYRQKEGGEAEVFLDPNTMSEDGTTSLAGLSFSKDASLVAYQISEGGSDWRKVIVLNAETKEQVGETLVDVKFSGISWFGNEGFYYSSYDKPKGSELSAKTDQHKVYYHKIGTPQVQDKVIFGATDAQKHRYVYGGVTDDKKYLVISAAVSTSGNKLFIRDLSKPDSDWVTILDHTNSDTSVIHSEGDTLFLSTNLDAPNRRIVKVNAKQPQPKNWQDVVPETNNVLSVSTGSGYLFATYIKDAISLVKQYDFTGKLIRDIALPGVGTVSGFSGEEEDKVLYYSFTNYNTPRSIFAFDAKSGVSELYSSDKVDFDSDAYVSKQVFYTSKDGTRVPMIITHKKGLKLDGNNPTLLYGYGGFNVSLKPYFSPTRAAWLELGGVYAVANLRGGGEYGKKWHKAGTQMQKQNVFDDFIAAGEYLVSENYTSSEKLAINGGSNGGLLVGATMLQRPDLFKVAVPAVGVLDMLRYHTFTAGAGWAYDYGTAEDNKEMFEYLKGYSPVHNVKAGVDYPATMITTGDHDDRVVPAHSYKFAAELQSKHTGPNPTLIRIETNAGHGAGTPISKTIEQYADIYGFTLYNMGIKSL
ncbi:MULTISPECIES: prolyl oligopeptidase family serine peptidase [unclassified Pseudoalteromonas]|uniref:prolyl oligopeptidase family serine peptidase n=1 Tax=unclassified Pseudoalteromonas TaxID=194690 RepID=UPI001F2DDF5D|nr:MULTISPECIES: prolyl oligopeptidase family serine peptidase [unclassified Pseudoalteromonas]MCF2828505.1 prolyl oligopeptidase family serine peptidase [Pseudoalteromonas sp. OF5H-5]MCF2832393.1 prolyl oligopeptidase family serine peptidase [Pseudoalteromonas sp. DL2-H6]MCF2924891.1 prolyl oligopeptidase family serine peptidase [Pseudoalteromonas sp. DL2-H1]